MKSVYFSFIFLLFLFVSSTAQTYKVGDAVSIEWKGKWFPGKILEVKGTNYKISYDGYGADWHETVASTRLKPAEAVKPTSLEMASVSGGNEYSYKGLETIWDVQASSNDKLIVCASASGKVVLLSATDLSLVAEIKCGTSPVMSASISSDGKYIAAGCGEGMVYIYTTSDNTNWTLYTTLETYSSISRLRFSPVNNDLYIAGAPKVDYTKSNIDVWNTDEKKFKQTLLKSIVGDHVISAISFTKDGSKVAFAISNTKSGIEVFETATGKLAYRIATKFDVVACSFSADGSLIAGGGTDKAVNLWKTSTKTIVWTSTWSKGTTDYLYGVAIAPDAKSIAAVGTGTGNKIKVYDITSGKITAEFSKSNPGGNAVSFSSDSKKVFAGFTTYGDIAKVTNVYMTSLGQ